MAQIRSEMAGTLLEWKVKQGDAVQSGQEIAIVESMKMEVPLVSSLAGKVSALLKSPGDFINDGEAVLELA